MIFNIVFTQHNVEGSGWSSGETPKTAGTRPTRIITANISMAYSHMIRPGEYSPSTGNVYWIVNQNVRSSVSLGGK